MLLIALPSCTLISASHNRVILQEERECEHEPLQAEDQSAKPADQLQDLDRVVLPHIGLELLEELIRAGEDEDGDGALEDGGEDSGDHVEGVAAVGGGGCG